MDFPVIVNFFEFRFYKKTNLLTIQEWNRENFPDNFKEEQLLHKGVLILMNDYEYKMHRGDTSNMMEYVTTADDKNIVYTEGKKARFASVDKYNVAKNFCFKSESSFEKDL